MIKNKHLPFVLVVFWLGITLAFWYLAFVPMPETPPQWLMAAKRACFGTLPDGLPDTFGWLTLTLAPLSLLIGILVVWPKDVKDGFNSIFKNFSGKVFLSLLVFTTLWEGLWIATRIHDGLSIRNTSFLSTQTGSLPETYPQTNKPAPNWSLLDQYGDEISLQTFKGKTLWLTFAFAHCQTVCPSVVQQTTQAMNQLTEEERSHLGMAIVTLDPWRDTPGALPRLAQEWKLPANAHVLSGDPTIVTAVLDRYQIPWKRDENTGDVAHPPITYVINPHGDIAYSFNNPSPAWLLDAFRIVSKM